jgi:phenylacetic acid degradation operon negative regulatory protein
LAALQCDIDAHDHDTHLPTTCNILRHVETFIYTASKLMSTTKGVDRAIKRLIRIERPRAKSLVFTVFGDSITPHGGAVWLGQLVDLLAPFGITERLVRSSVFRLVQDGWLEAHRHGRRSLYTFTPTGRLRFERAHQKVYSPPQLPWNGNWTLVITNRIANQARTLIRRELEWEGYRALSQGTYIRPGGDVIALGEILDRLHLRTKIVVCNAQDNSEFDTQSLSSNVSSLWNLAAVSSAYQKFITQFKPVAELAEASNIWTPEAAFMVRTLLIHAFRRVLLHDPLLPRELLPPQWPGEDAYNLCRTIYRRIYKPAEQQITAALAEDLTSSSDALDVFHLRFGGLGAKSSRN